MTVPYDNKKTTPSRKARKSSRNKIFLENKYGSRLLKRKLQREKARSEGEA
jgi:hypothetical protein